MKGFVVAGAFATTATLACSSAAPAPSVTLNEVAQSAPVEATPKPVVERTPDCATFARDARRAALEAEGETDASVLARTLVGFCSASWRIDMPNLNGVDPREAVFAVEARFTIVHTDAHGERAYAFMPDTLSNYGERIPRAPVLFDFDGDGDPEIFLDVREEGDEGHAARTNALVTFKSGKIEPFAHTDALDIDTMEDVDGDGRPDLRIFAGYTDGLESCGSGFTHDRPPSKFVAHARADGTFSTTDDAAKRYASRWCAARPSAITSSDDAICARLFAIDATRVTSEMKRVSASCVTGYCERELRGQAQPPLSTEDCGRRQQWFALTPPFTF